MAFVTGSHAYGTPNVKSDIDLVVLVSPADHRRLREQAAKAMTLQEILADVEAFEANPDNGYDQEDVVSLRYGRLNLLCTCSLKHYNVWKKGTAFLRGKKPVTRDYAVRYFKKLRKANSIGDSK